MSQGTSADPEALTEFSIQSRMQTDSLNESTNSGIGAYQSFKDLPNEVYVGGGQIETSPFLHVTEIFDELSTARASLPISAAGEAVGRAKR